MKITRGIIPPKGYFEKFKNLSINEPFSAVNTTIQEKFNAYVKVKKSELTNMGDLPMVIRLAKKLYDMTLTNEDCIDIMKNYAEYEEKYKIK